MKNPVIERLMKEQEGLRKFEFKVRIENGGARRTMTIWANTALYAHKMAAEQLAPGDKIIWVK